jgi:hypothetical protein
MYWRIILGVILIIAGVSEYASVLADWKGIKHHPFGVEAGLITFCVIGYLLIKKGLKTRKAKKESIQ